MNSKSKDIIIVGAFHEIVELCELCSYHIIGIIDSYKNDQFMGYKILGLDSDASEVKKKYPNALIVISPDSSCVKRDLVSLYEGVGFDFASVISPKALVSRSAVLGKGVIVQSGVNISSMTVVGDFCKINFNANIMHDVRIGDFSIIAPNAVVLGRAYIGSDVYVGANATIFSDAIIPTKSHIEPLTFFR